MLMRDELDRRQSKRRIPDGAESLGRVKLRIGPELTVLDIGNHGVLVEGRSRLTPGARVDIHVVPPEGRVLMRTTVVRAYVSQLQHDRVIYRAGLKFDHPVVVVPAG
jgi:hypothetical protein